MAKSDSRKLLKIQSVNACYELESLIAAARALTEAHCDTELTEETNDIVLAVVQVMGVLNVAQKLAQDLALKVDAIEVR